MCDSELLFETGCGDVEAEAMKMPMPLASNGAPIHFFQAGSVSLVRRHYFGIILVRSDFLAVLAWIVSCNAFP